MQNETIVELCIENWNINVCQMADANRLVLRVCLHTNMNEIFTQLWDHWNKIWNEINRIFLYKNKKIIQHLNLASKLIEISV